MVPQPLAGNITELKCHVTCPTQGLPSGLPVLGFGLLQAILDTPFLQHGWQGHTGWKPQSLFRAEGPRSQQLL